MFQLLIWTTRKGTERIPVASMGVGSCLSWVLELIVARKNVLLWLTMSQKIKICHQRAVLSMCLRVFVIHIGSRFMVMRAQSSRNWARSPELRRISAQAAESSLRVMLVLRALCPIHSLPGGLLQKGHQWSQVWEPVSVIPFLWISLLIKYRLFICRKGNLFCNQLLLLLLA